VVIGCYPVVGEVNYETKLTVEASNLDQLKAAMLFIKSKVPANTVVDLFPLEVALDKLQHSNCRDKTASAYKIFEECSAKYPDGEMVISFNGGKDCTLLLHLYHIFLRLEFFPWFKYLP
jgi:FAD synthetase